MHSTANVGIGRPGNLLINKDQEVDIADWKSACRWFDSNVQGCTGVAKAMDGRERPPLATTIFKHL